MPPDRPGQSRRHARAGPPTHTGMHSAMPPAGRHGLDTASARAVAFGVPHRTAQPTQGGAGLGMSRLVFGWLTALVAAMPPWLAYGLADLLTEIHFQLFPSRRH